MDLTQELKHRLIALTVCQVSIVLVQMLLMRQVSAKKAITAKVALSTTLPMVVEFTLKQVSLSLVSMLRQAQLTRFPVQRAPTMVKRVKKSVPCAPLVSFAISCSLPLVLIVLKVITVHRTNTSKISVRQLSIAKCLVQSARTISTRPRLSSRIA